MRGLASERVRRRQPRPGHPAQGIAPGPGGGSHSSLASSVVVDKVVVWVGCVAGPGGVACLTFISLGPCPAPHRAHATHSHNPLTQQDRRRLIRALSLSLSLSRSELSLWCLVCPSASTDYLPEASAITCLEIDYLGPLSPGQPVPLSPIQSSPSPSVPQTNPHSFLQSLFFRCLPCSPPRPPTSPPNP